MIDINEENLLRQLRESKDIEIERLLNQYSTSLEDVRAMYPQLTETISQRQALTTFPTEPMFFTPSEAAQMGLSLQEGWMLKISPTEKGLTSSFITPEKWEITEDDLYISPEGTEYSRADIEALLSMPTGELTQVQAPEEAFKGAVASGRVGGEIAPLTIENLTEEGKIQYKEYQFTGGELDVSGWVDLRERQQLEPEQIFGKVFPEQDISEIYNYIEANPEGFLADLKEAGWNADTEALLKYLIPEITNEEMQTIFGQVAPYVPESIGKDFRDTLFLGGVNFIYGLGMQFLGAWPSFMETIGGAVKNLVYEIASIPGQVGAFLGLTIEGKPREEAAVEAKEIGREVLKPITQTADQVIAQILPSIQKKAEENFLRLMANQDTFIQEHPELQPKPEYNLNPFEHPELFRDPGWVTHVIGSSLAYSLTVMGTMIVMGAAGGPFAAIPAGMMVAGGPEAASMVEELVKQGVPFEEAVQWGELYGLVAGGVETVSDLPFLGLVFKPLQQVTKPIWNTIFRGVANRIVRGVLAGLLIPQGEALEEIITQITHNAILQHYDETQSILEGVSQAYIQAVIASLPFGAIGGAASYRTFRNNLSPDVGKQLDDLVTELQTQGLNEEQAQVQAVNELARNTENEAELSKAIEVAKLEYLESQGVSTVEELIPKPELSDKILDEIRIAEEIKVTPVTPEVTAKPLSDYEAQWNKAWNSLSQSERLKWLGKAKLPSDVASNPAEQISLEAKQDLINAGLQPTKDIWQMTAYNFESNLAYLEWLQKQNPTQLTQAQYIERYVYNKPEGMNFETAETIAKGEHKAAIRETLSHGTPVAPQILEDYPDLKPTPEVPSGQKPYSIGQRVMVETTKGWIEGEVTGYRAGDVDEDFLRIDVKTAKRPYIGCHPDAIRAIPQAPAGMPEAGLQAGIPSMAAAEVVRPQPTGKLVQARIDDYLRLRDYNKQAVADRIAEIKKLLETPGRLPKGKGTKGDLRLELARLNAQQELDAVQSIAGLDGLIRDVENELGLRSMPYRGQPYKKGIKKARHPGVPNIFPEYTSRQLEEMRNVYLQAREKMKAEVPVFEPTPKPEPTQAEIERVKTDPTPASDETIIKKFIECIKDAKPAREVTEALKHEELSKRAAIFASILQGGEGYKAFEKAKGALRGFLPQGEYILDLQKFGITDAEIERMFDRIRLDDKLRPFEKLNTAEALTDLLTGGIPTEGELTLLEREFGSELAKTILNKMSTRVEKAIRIAQDIANIPRTLITIADLSATFRQAALLAFGQPVQFSKAFVSQLKVVFSENNFKLIDEIVHNNVYAEKAEQHKLYIAPISEIIKVAAREEAFMGRLIERVPIIGNIVRASERAYITMLNVLRIETWAYYCKQWEGTGKTNQDYDKLAAFINHASGRGDLGSFSRAAPWLSATFFSPRWIMSHVQVPLDLINTTPAVRKVVARNLVSFMAVGLLAQLLAELGGGDTEKDPRSADFGKIKIGNTRIDYWAGYLPYIRVIAQIITEERKSTKTGEVYKIIDPIDVGVNFFRSKLAPVPGLLWDLKSGKTFIGEELTAENAEKIIFEKLTPMFIQDLIEAVKDSGLAAIGYGLLSALGVGIQTYSDNWESAELKLGLPVRADNFPYTIENEIYDVKDYYSEISGMIGGATYEMLLDKNIPEKVLSVAKAKDILREISLLPNKRLININADSTKGDTYEQYRVQWLARQKITNPDELKQFDKDYPDAYLGNITQAQYALLVEYHSLPEAEKADFLGRHPELYINPREEWLRTHPQENALLTLWGKADIYSLDAQSKVSSLAKTLGIPENALVMKDLDEVTELKLKNQKLFDLLEAYGGLDDTLKGPDGLTARDRAIQQLYLDNPEFRDDQRRIDALNVGTKDNPTLETMVEGWVERGQIADEFGAGSREMKLWLIDNKEIHQWALENALLTDTGEDWNENILRLQVNYGDQFDLYDDYGNEKSPSYIANDTVRADTREAMLFGTQGMTSFGVAYYTIDALQMNLPENLIPTYVDYFEVRKKEGVDYSAGWYEDDWFLMEHKEFYDTMYELDIWTEPKDFSKVPTREVYKLYQTYNTLPKTGDARLNFRYEHPELDAWLVLAKKYTPVGDRWTTTNPALANRKYWLDMASHYKDLLKNLGIREDITAQELTDSQAQEIEAAIRALRGY